MKTIPTGFFIEERVSQILKKLRTVPDGKFAMHARRAMKPITNIIKDFEEYKKEIIEKYSDNGQSISPMTKGEDGTESPNPKYQQASKEINEAVLSDIDVTWEPFLTDEEVERIKIDLTIEDLDLLEFMNLYSDTKEEHTEA
jgi:hypothetical protein